MTTFHERAERVETELLMEGFAALDYDSSTSAEGADWPTLDPAALYGLPGDVVRTIEPTTEADPAALLFSFLAFAGCYVSADVRLEHAFIEHPARIWPLITGGSSRGAKGTAVSATNRLIKMVDPDFMVKNRASGLSTSEGLIRRVRDSTGDDPDAKDFDEGVNDKRLLVQEAEFASVLTRARREGNNLSGTVRDAYDDEPLQTLTSGNPMQSTGHHIAILGSITPSELVEKLTGTDISNGFANRFMVVCSQRSKYLSRGGMAPTQALRSLASNTAAARRNAAGMRTVTLDDDAADLWDSIYKPRHERYAGMPAGVLTDLFGRWHANILRMSLIYALLDGRRKVTEAHLNAALAAYDYVEQSTKYVFGSEDADPMLGRLIEFVETAEGVFPGRTRSEVSSVLFRNNMPRRQLDALYAKAVATGRYEVTKIPNPSGKGRKVELLHRTLTGRKQRQPGTEGS